MWMIRGSSSVDGLTYTASPATQLSLYPSTVNKPSTSFGGGEGGASDR